MENSSMLIWYVKGALFIILYAISQGFCWEYSEMHLAMPKAVFAPYFVFELLFENSMLIFHSKL